MLRAQLETAIGLLGNPRYTNRYNVKAKPSQLRPYLLHKIPYEDPCGGHSKKDMTGSIPAVAMHELQQAG